jgi:serine protease Do
MKSNLLLNIMFSVFGFMGCVKTFAQEKTTTKETQEITIRKSGDKDTKVTVEINGNTITINGKPLAEFKEDGITINNRKMIIRDGDNITMMLDADNMKEWQDLKGLSKLENLGNYFSQNYATGNKVYLGVMTNGNNNEGAIIKSVMKESPAADAGLLKDDIIYKMDDQKITNRNDLSSYVLSKKVGDKVKVYFLRDNKKKDIIATLGENKQLAEIEDLRVFKYNQPNGNGQSFSLPRMRNLELQGFGSNNFSFGNRPKLGIKIQDTEESNGVKILDVEKASTSEVAGLQKNDIIVGIADKQINNTDEAREALNDNKDKASYGMKIKRNGLEMNMTIKIPKKLKTATL